MTLVQQIRRAGRAIDLTLLLLAVAYQAPHPTLTIKTAWTNAYAIAGFRTNR